MKKTVSFDPGTIKSALGSAQLRQSHSALLFIQLSLKANRNVHRFEWLRIHVSAKFEWFAKN
jgi:hypothetical protein